MKIIIFSLICLMSHRLWARSEDYTCQSWQYKAEITLDDKSSHMWFYIDNQLIDQNYVGFIEKLTTKTRYHFYFSQAGPIILSFNNQDLNNMPKKMQGFIEGDTLGWHLWDEINCTKRE